jgi:hypothetical protein
VEDYRNLITEHDLATELRVSVWTLRAWRRREYGPDAVKMGKRIFYRRTEVTSFLGGLERCS